VAQCHHPFPYTTLFRSKGVVTVYSGKVDLGTGTDTALTQIAAEELGVPMQRVKLVTGDTLLTPDQGPTFGSLTIQNGGVQIRQRSEEHTSELQSLAYLV